MWRLFLLRIAVVGTDRHDCLVPVLQGANNNGLNAALFVRDRAQLIAKGNWATALNNRKGNG